MCDAFAVCPDNALFAPGDEVLDKIASDQNWVNRYYRVLLNGATQLEDDAAGSAFVLLAHAAYGWMPTILHNCYLEHLPSPGTVFADLRACQTQQEASAYLLGLAGPPVNDSWVGTSKVFHFINPDVFPIWDLKVGRHFGFNYPGALHAPGRYAAYLNCLHGRRDGNAQSIHGLQARFEQNFGYTPSKIRCLELMLFHQPPGPVP